MKPGTPSRASATRPPSTPKSLKGPATGPIYVNGAQPGDALKVEFLKITPKESPAHMVMPGRGFLEAEFTEGYPTVMAIQDGHVVLPTGVKIKMLPSMGLVATTPTYVQNTASDSGPYGGDIDMKELVEGSTSSICPSSWTAASWPSATATPSSATAPWPAPAPSVPPTPTSALPSKRASTSPRPGPLTPDHFVVLSYGEDLAPAMKQAVRDMVDFLVSEKGLAPYDAYTLCSLAGDVRVSRTFRPISPVKMMLSREALAQL